MGGAAAGVPAAGALRAQHFAPLRHARPPEVAQGLVRGGVCRCSRWGRGLAGRVGQGRPEVFLNGLRCGRGAPEPAAPAPRAEPAALPARAAGEQPAVARLRRCRARHAQRLPHADGLAGGSADLSRHLDRQLRGRGAGAFPVLLPVVFARGAGYGPGPCLLCGCCWLHGAARSGGASARTGVRCASGMAGGGLPGHAGAGL
mmetsp:Transcript_43525/g.120970  ORF Transcript_43525/g.120970 Transcript_43525/m.120970 type:complete len:202 (+) Transcript_43525:651-1256(+)